MQREATRPDGLWRLVRCVARGVDGHAALLDGVGRPLYAFPEVWHDLLAAVADDVRRVQFGRARSVTAEHDARVVVLVPVGDTPTVASSAVDERIRVLARDRDDLDVGASQVVSLRETTVGYEQASYALADARDSAGHYARFDPTKELAALLGGTGRD